jgi:S-adenosylmethionine:tRNA ribosyltransferase-isomerase
MRLSDFDYELPAESIAQKPRPRGTSKLLVVDRGAGTWQEHTIRELPRLLRRGDLLVANDTRVFPARLLGRRDPSGGAAECLLLERVGDTDWIALVHPGQKLKPGARMIFDDPGRAPGLAIHGEIRERMFFGRRRVTLTVAADKTAAGIDIDRAIDRLGHVPLPPYIHRPDDPDDHERYQTIFARERGSVAAPTAGLHFDRQLLSDLRAAGIEWATLTLHVGYGTFKPVRSEDVLEHRVDAEHFGIPPATADGIRQARADGRRVIAVGTTTTRALETAAGPDGIEAGPGITELFIHPGHRFRMVDGLLTNFHLPRSSLFMLVCAFAGRELMLAAYRDAIARGFLFYSYGDAMLIA